MWQRLGDEKTCQRGQLRGEGKQGWRVGQTGLPCVKPLSSDSRPFSLLFFCYRSTLKCNINHAQTKLITFLAAKSTQWLLRGTHIDSEFIFLVISNEQEFVLVAFVWELLTLCWFPAWRARGLSSYGSCEAAGQESRKLSARKGIWCSPSYCFQTFEQFDK